jgi:ABC-type antimicrobial peptide transport system permease subunit
MRERAGAPLEENFELSTATAPSTLVAPIQAAVASVNKEIPLEFHTLAEQVNDSLVQERTLAVLSVFFGGLALLLAMVGLYGALSYMLTQRQAEFGIRMTRGAEAGSIVRLVMRDVAIILGGGILADALISLTTTRVATALLFGIGARGPVTMVGAVAVLFGGGVRCELNPRPSGYQGRSPGGSRCE